MNIPIAEQPMPTVAYVVKRYPVYSQTFIVNEILAHEAAGMQTRIFALHPPNDAHFQDSIARVRAPVTYLQASSSSSVKASELWGKLRELGASSLHIWPLLENFSAEDAGDVYCAALLALEVKRRGIQHLHAHFATSATTVARMAAQFADITYSFTAHARDIFSNEVQPDDLGRKLADAAATVTVSDYNCDFIRQAFGTSARRIYNGLDLARFSFEPPHPRLRKIVAVGRLVEKKGFADLIEACAILRQRGIEFFCEVIGGGELHAVLQTHIAHHKLQDVVHLLGELPQAEVMRHVQEAAAFVAPCVIASNDDRDGLPTVLTEAMALGTPCISTDVTGIPELVRHGDTGLQVPQRNPLALAHALACLLDDTALRQRLAANARALIEAEFDVNQNAADLRQIWQMAVESRHRTSPSRAIKLAWPVAPSTQPSTSAPALAEVTR